MLKVLVTTVPFGETNKLPLELMENISVDVTINPLNRKLTEIELSDLIEEFDILVAGTEPITKKVLQKATRLKLISRVGIGVDNVDLNEAKKRNILVAYTPDAPAPAVAELTIGLMLSLLRSIHISNHLMHNGEWKRIFGRRITEVTIGIIGVGRIGSRVLRRISSFGSPQILANDINSDVINNSKIAPSLKINWVSKEEIYKNSDLISIHIPKTSLTSSLITKKELLTMRSDTLIINTSRGGIVNEDDLFEVLSNGHLGGCAIDVFDNEPYNGPLSKIQRCILTSHMGSMSVDCRSRMEIEAVEELVRYVRGKKLKRPVPLSEYEIQKAFFKIEKP